MSVAPSVIANDFDCVHGAMYLNVSNDTYHSLPGTSSSNIRDIADDLRAYMLDGKPEHEDSDAKLLGSAAHCYILQPDLFYLEYVVYPGKVRRGKQWDEFKEENTGCTIITSKMYERCIGMRDALDEAGWSWVRDADMVNESSVWAYEQHSKVLCKVRPDIYHPESHMITDLKTTSNPHWEGQGKYKKGFKYSVRKFGYYIQHPFYVDTLLAAGVPCSGFRFLCVQSSEPYDVVLHNLSGGWINDGRSEYIKQLKRLRSAAISYDGE